MNIEALLITLRARGVKITDKGAALDFEPPSLVTPDEAEFIRANADAFAELVRRPEAKPETLTIDLHIEEAIERQRQSAEDELARRMPAPTKTTRFRNTRGELMPLEGLTAQDVQRLRRRGSLTDEEAKRWLSRSSKGFVF